MIELKDQSQLSDVSTPQAFLLASLAEPLRRRLDDLAAAGSKEIEQMGILLIAEPGDTLAGLEAACYPAIHWPTVNASG